MKIGDLEAPVGEIDQQNVRAETCIFMVKLPRYSSEDVMRRKLVLAIECALDPLSG